MPVQLEFCLVLVVPNRYKYSNGIHISPVRIRHPDVLQNIYYIAEEKMNREFLVAFVLAMALQVLFFLKKKLY